MVSSGTFCIFPFTLYGLGMAQSSVSESMAECGDLLYEYMKQSWHLLSSLQFSWKSRRVPFKYLRTQIGTV